ncbi:MULTISPECIES: helix-turn-helix transcriptional regulator [Microbacterium]|uniref:YafY family transcriptional regulator n=1 Tax=Microbacterium wangchenii TaxID=2541726 RepID=A0ABX5SRK0_9MICO|nr:MULTISPECIES: YafY family protein [Microbacterium]MCK6066576.1 YafY family transcriptional regulator [Microbacterium sp. EYE_512]QBR87912.1 YafY family transcriptional regulator [Microbacterium wangchenii]TFV83965.1 YafY family transcriptional regulator [Microbacterium sp. dk485]TXK18298.1 YafY family transcriptional regulator [Microbacterium wangchenii]
MSDTTSRALSLLNLLQTHRHWPGPELAARLGVTERTVRRDVDRLRELGYRIESTPGAAGGYRLEAGSAVPPLLLTDEEAVAMAIGLRIAASQRLVGGAETALTALAKLDQVLPTAVRRRVAALADAVRPVGVGGGEAASTEVLGELALACRDSERVRFTYTSASGESTHRRVEPHTLSPADRHWYLLCWDLDRDDWRTFRVDRLSGIEHTRVLFAPRELSQEQVDEFILVARSWVRQPVEADIVMELPLEDMRALFGQWGQGATAEDDERTRWPVGGSDWRETMYGMSWVPAGVPYTTDLPEPHRAEMREALTRMLQALAAPPPPPRP